MKWVLKYKFVVRRNATKKTRFFEPKIVELGTSVIVWESSFKKINRLKKKSHFKLI
jgi:hypothetical protein